MSLSRGGTPAAAKADATFPRDARLTRKADFDRVLRTPTRCASLLFRAQVAAGEGPGIARLGLAIAKRIVRRAHDRNRLKRHTREVFRGVRMSLPCIDIVVFARPEALAANASALRSDLAKLFERTRSLNPARDGGTMPAVAQP